MASPVHNSRKIYEHKVQGKRLGRHIEHDERSKDFPAREASTIADIHHLTRGPQPLDQGALGSCTANALCGARNIDPDYGGRGDFYEKDAIWLYWQEVVAEGYSKGQDVGGTGLMVCKVAKAAGWITGYTHAFSLTSALSALMFRPVITGVNWYDSFDTPDSSGVIHLTPGAQIRGGHEFVVDQIDTVKQLVGCWQSWGPNWGINGRFYMPYSVWDRLLSESGDVTVPIR